MYKHYLYLVFFSNIAICFSCTSTQDKSHNIYKVGYDNHNNSLEYPKLTIENAIYKFGKIKKGEEVKHSFHIKNKGKAPLIINNTHPSCGCTVSSHPKKPILYNQIDSIVIIFTSEEFGIQNKVISINSNDKTSLQKLVLIGEVI